MKKLALFEGSWQKVLIKVSLLLLVLFVVYRILKDISWKPSKQKEAVDQFIQNDLPTIIPVDNSSPSDPDTISDSEAELIANSLETGMTGLGTDTNSMLTGLQCLNGASLNKVYAEFGVRPYDSYGTVSDRDLFGWFAGELSDALFVTGVYYNECVDGCTTYWNQCKELTYMRKIWSKSSIPVTF
tara:strand:- start:227 stop:781 length:555 start_codon:yes stop_codon:yes gene_type:complete